MYEKLPNTFIRSKALKETLFLIRAEDENTKFLDLGPVHALQYLIFNLLISSFKG